MDLGPWATAKQKLVDSLDLDYYPSDDSVEAAIAAADEDGHHDLDPNNENDQEVVFQYLLDLFA